MAAVGDIVSPNIRVGSDPAPVLVQPPVLGLVASIDGSSFPDRIIWYNTRVASPSFAAAADVDASLDLIQAPVSPAADVAALVARVVRRVTGTAATFDPSGGTSREYDGVVAQAYSRVPLESGGTAVDFLLVKVLDRELWIEDQLARFVAVGDR